MKLFTVEVLSSGTKERMEIAGRNRRDSILIGDELAVEDRPDCVVRVTGIEVYHKSVGELHHDCAGTLFIERVSGDGPRLNERLVSNS